MKKTIALVLAVALLLVSLAGCEGFEFTTDFSSIPSHVDPDELSSFLLPEMNLDTSLMMDLNPNYFRTRFNERKPATIGELGDMVVDLHSGYTYNFYESNEENVTLVLKVERKTQRINYLTLIGMSSKLEDYVTALYLTCDPSHTEEDAEAFVEEMCTQGNDVLVEKTDENFKYSYRQAEGGGSFMIEKLEED